MDLSYVTLNLDKATKAVKDWSTVTKAGITKVKMVGTWNSSYQHSFDADYYSGNEKITSIDLSGVTGSDGYNLPSSFCQTCSSLSEVKLPNDLESIPSCGFFYCLNLKKIDITPSVISIENKAFGSCRSLASIELPSKMETIAREAFYNCSGLKKVVCNATTPPSLAEDVFLSTPSDKVLYVPDETAVKVYKASEKWYAAFGDNIKPISEMPEDE
jgi:hypothetical protein